MPSLKENLLRFLDSDEWSAPLRDAGARMRATPSGPVHDVQRRTYQTYITTDHVLRKLSSSYVITDDQLRKRLLDWALATRQRIQSATRLSQEQATNRPMNAMRLAVEASSHDVILRQIGRAVGMYDAFPHPDNLLAPLREEEAVPV